MKFSKNFINKKYAPKIIFFNEIFFYKDSDIFWHRKLTLKVRILPFLTAFVQLSVRHKNFLGGWLLVLGIKEGLVECATVCVKSVVILTFLHYFHMWKKRKNGSIYFRRMTFQTKTKRSTECHQFWFFNEKVVCILVCI